MIAPSKLGRLVAREWQSDDGLVHRLREKGLVRAGVSDDDLKATFRQAREEIQRFHRVIGSSTLRTSESECSWPRS